jgi:hypothetical protein
MSGFNGDIEQWYFMAGEGSWVGPEAAPCEVEGSCSINPPKEENCVYLYEECNFGGRSSYICDNSPFTDIDYEVKSIAIPEDTTVYVYNMPCFNGESAEITETISCLNTNDGEEDIDF